MDPDFERAINLIDFSRLDSALELLDTAPEDRFHIWTARKNQFAMQILAAGLDDDTARMIEEYKAEFLEELFPQAKWEVECAVSDSMVSGVWGIQSFNIGDKGYFVESPDWGAGEEPYRLLGAWAPAEDLEAYRRAFVEMYARSWDVIGLPPMKGQHASGPIDLMVEALFRIGGSGALDDWSEEIRRGLDKVDPIEVAEKAGLPPETVSVVLADIRSGNPPAGIEDEVAGRARLALGVAAIDTSPF